MEGGTLWSEVLPVKDRIDTLLLNKDGSNLQLKHHEEVTLNLRIFSLSTLRP